MFLCDAYVFKNYIIITYIWHDDDDEQDDRQTERLHMRTFILFTFAFGKFARKCSNTCMHILNTFELKN